MTSRAEIGCAALFAALAGSPTIRACVEISSPKDSPSSFTVVATDRGKPLSGFKVVIDGLSSAVPQVNLNGDSPPTHITDSNGYARFEHVPEGYYRVHLAQPNGTGLDIHVVPSMLDPKYVVQLVWPALKVITVSKPAGTIRAICRSNAGDCPLATNLTLVRATTSEEIKHASINGSFDFGEVPDGLYFLRLRPDVKGNWDPAGDVAVEVDHASPKQSIQIDVGMSDCGMSYSGGCPMSPVLANGLCGVVNDPVGAAIGNASLQLVDRLNGRVVGSGVTDAAGRFDLSEKLSRGEYLFSVFSLGFTPSRIPLKVERRASCHSNMHIRMDIMGTCGVVEMNGNTTNAQTH